MQIALQRDRDLGSIEVAKTADLVALNKNLFEVGSYDIHTVAPEAVLLEGQLVSGRLPGRGLLMTVQSSNGSEGSRSAPPS